MNQELQHPLTDQEIAAKKEQERKALLERVAELEQRVAALENK